MAKFEITKRIGGILQVKSPIDYKFMLGLVLILRTQITRRRLEQFQFVDERLKHQGWIVVNYRHEFG